MTTKAVSDKDASAGDILFMFLSRSLKIAGVMNIGHRDL
jgi:hypothetical protein